MSAGEFTENLLQDTYSIDDQSFKEEDESNSLPSSSKSLEDVQYINFIQAIKEDNVEVVKTLSQAHSSFVNKIGPEGLTGIQYAALFSNAESFKLLFEKGASVDCFVEGLPLLHLSLSFAIFEHHRLKGIDFFKYLYENNQVLRDQKDRLGRKIVHLIVIYDLYEALKIIDIDQEDLICKDYNGESAINYVYQYQSFSVFETLCLSIGIKKLYSFIRDHNIKFIEGCFVFHCFQPIQYLINNSKEIFDELIEDITNTIAFYPNSEEIISNCQLAIDYLNHNGNANIDNGNNDNDAHDNDAHDNNSNTYINSKLNKEKELLFQTSNNTTALVFNNNCILHIKLPEDPIKRIKLRHEQIENSDRLNVLMQPPFGILLNDKMMNSHSFIYNECEKKAALADILRCHDIAYINKMKAMCENAQETPMLIDTDTYINKSTFNSIFDATGCVIEGVDLVMSKKATNAFVLVRPPGHHAGYFGAVTLENQNSPISNGFCIVNNVCIGAAYCKYQYKDIIDKIAIVDFDVHHGNGTEEIVSLLNQKEMRASYQSILGNMSITKTMMNPWLDYDDPSNVLFISLHAFNEENPKSFYPYSGSISTNTQKVSPIYPGGILNIPITKNMRYSYEYRNIFRQKVIQRLHKFKPDIIFISAGFDGHEKEEINDRMMCLNEFDYSFLTEQIQTVANKYCEGRLVSVLEGGYNVESGIVSSFAQSVMMHVKGLNTTINKAKIQEGQLTQLKRQREYEKDYENFCLAKGIGDQPRRSERLRHNAEEKDKERQINIQDLNNVFSYENDVKRKNDLKSSCDQDEKMEGTENDISNNKMNDKDEDGCEEFLLNEEEDLL